MSFSGKERRRNRAPSGIRWLSALLPVVCLACPAPQQGVPDDGPRGEPPTLWSRKLGPGYSGIVVDEDRLYTMFRDGSEEVVVRLDARTGETVWAHRYDSTPVKGHDPEYGVGPNSTPLLSDGLLYAVGVAGALHCLDATTGTALWTRDLWGDLGGTFLDFGYSSSPVPYRDTVIVLVGGPGRGAVAFDRHDGSIVWQGLDFANSYSSPNVMSLLGKDHLVAFMATEVVGADPENGELRWQYPIRNQYPQNICRPIRVDDDLLFISTMEAGSRGLRVVEGDGFDVEEIWSSNRMQCFYGSAVRFGDHVYGPSGWSAAPLLAAMNARTGELAWRKRGFGLANVVGVGEQLAILGDDGVLGLATPSPEGLTVHASSRILTEPARTAPTIVGDLLFARDMESIVALDLGAGR